MIDTVDIQNNEITETNKDVLTFQEAMEMLGFKKSAMYQLIKLPNGPKFTQIGGRKIITRRALLKWIDDFAGTKI